MFLHSHVGFDSTSDGIFTLLVLAVHEVFVKHFVYQWVAVVVAVGSTDVRSCVGVVVGIVAVTAAGFYIPLFVSQKFPNFCIDISVSIAVVD